MKMISQIFIRPAFKFQLADERQLQRHLRFEFGKSKRSQKAFIEADNAGALIYLGR
jgi:hypothetical protein